MNAYSELYMNDARCNLGEMLQYAVCDCGYAIDDFFSYFACSSIGRQFEIGNPKYVTGMSGVELARDVIYVVFGDRCDIMPSRNINRSAEYWAGWAIAYYQWLRGLRFTELIQTGLTADKVLSMYILHETDETKVAAAFDAIVLSKKNAEISRLKRLRAYAGYTQKELSEVSGVSLRMIQLYEQGQNDLSKAQANVVLHLAQALHCDVRELLSTY